MRETYSINVKFITKVILWLVIFICLIWYVRSNFEFEPLIGILTGILAIISFYGVEQIKIQKPKTLIGYLKSFSTNKKLMVVTLIITLSSIGIYYWYSKKDLFTCSDYISFMTASVDEFENEMRGVPVTDVGVVILPFGAYKEKEVQYREYGGGHVLADFFSWRMYPDIPATYFETNNSTVQV